MILTLLNQKYHSWYAVNHDSVKGQVGNSIAYQDLLWMIMLSGLSQRYHCILDLLLITILLVLRRKYYWIVRLTVNHDCAWLTLCTGASTCYHSPDIEAFSESSQGWRLQTPGLGWVVQSTVKLGSSNMCNSKYLTKAEMKEREKRKTLDILRVDYSLLIPSTKKEPCLLSYERDDIRIWVCRGVIDVNWDSIGLQGAISEK